MKKTIKIIFVILLIIFLSKISLANDISTNKEYNLKQEEAKEIINSVSSSTNSNELLNNTDKRIVYVTSTGSLYHIPGCSKLNSTPHALSISEANSKGYAPCKKCNPYNLADSFYKSSPNPYVLIGIISFIFIIIILIFIKYSSIISNTKIK